MYPKISIITPNLNGAQYLEETIFSVINQKYPNLEYIIIDGGSTDGSIEIIKKYESQLAYWISEPDGGLYCAIQKGFEKCTGEIMGWINSDDKYHSGSLSIVAEIFTDFPQVNWLTGNPTEFDEKGRTISIDLQRKWSKYDFLTFDYKWIQQESTFWTRKLWEKAGSKLNLNYRFAADLCLWMRFFRFEKLYVSNALIGGFRKKSSGQITIENFQEYITEAETIIKEEIQINSNLGLQLILNIFKAISLLDYLRIIRTDAIKNHFKNKYLDNSPLIIFNRTTQKFEICN